MILIGLGANLPSATHGTPAATLAAALDRLAALGVALVARSGWYRSAPVPVSDQPWFVNAVAAVSTSAGAEELLALLHQVEWEIGRERRERWGARSIDLDLLAYHDVVSLPSATLRIPHPRLHERAFVLLPLAEIAPDWHHPASGQHIRTLIAALDPAQRAEPMP